MREGMTAWFEYPVPTRRAQELFGVYELIAFVEVRNAHLIAQKTRGGVWVNDIAGRYALRLDYGDPWWDVKKFIDDSIKDIMWRKLKEMAESGEYELFEIGTREIRERDLLRTYEYTVYGINVVIDLAEDFDWDALNEKVAEVISKELGD